MKTKVFLVYDEADARRLLASNLAQLDCEAFTAANGPDGLNEARRVLPDVILLNGMLPDLPSARHRFNLDKPAGSDPQRINKHTHG
jgi:two-component system alkaline phosphatase synthesis response regulator PhoP